MVSDQIVMKLWIVWYLKNIHYFSGDEAEAIRLLEEGVNATYVDEHGRLPMHLAALRGTKMH